MKSPFLFDLLSVDIIKCQPFILLQIYTNCYFRILKSFILNMVLLVLNALSSFLSLIAACVISVGFSRWCDSLIVNAKVFYGFNIQDLRY